MSSPVLVVAGVNHKTAPISLLEHLSIRDEDLPKALHALRSYPHVVEGALLSTCNRVEVYAAVTRFHGGAQDLRNFLSEFCHVTPEELVDQLYTYHDEGAAKHLFRVASGVDSMIIGESEILGQVRRAFHAAVEEGTDGRLLGTAFRRALRAGKRARTESGIGRNPASISSAAVELARRAFGERTLAGRSVTIVGAGKMGRLAAVTLRSAGATDVLVVNRSEERGTEVAAEFGARWVGFDRLGDAIGAADIVLCSTTAPASVIDPNIVRDAIASREPDRPLLIVDIGVPRDVDPEVANLPGVVLRDIEDLRGVVTATMGSRLSEVARVEEIIGEEVDSFARLERSAETGPIAAAIVSKAEGTRRAELERLSSLFESMSPEDRAAVDHLTRRLVAKLLHTPLERLKSMADSHHDYLHLAVVRDLFELDDDDLQ